MVQSLNQTSLLLWFLVRTLLYCCCLLLLFSLAVNKRQVHLAQL
jgi:hypothetical protein